MTLLKGVNHFQSPVTGPTINSWLLRQSRPGLINDSFNATVSILVRGPVFHRSIHNNQTLNPSSIKVSRILSVDGAC